MSGQAEVPSVVAAYFGPMDDCRADHPVVAQKYVPGRGWVSCAGYRKRVSRSWVRKLRREEGVTHVALQRGRRIADFSVAEALR